MFSLWVKTWAEKKMKYLQSLLFNTRKIFLKEKNIMTAQQFLNKENSKITIYGIIKRENKTIEYNKPKKHIPFKSMP